VKFVELSLPYENFKGYVRKQLNLFFPDNRWLENNKDFDVAFNIALQRIELCFSNVTLKNYKKNGTPYLNHLYSDQYAVFLWFLSNSIWTETKDADIANKIFYLNKALHGFSCMFDTELPDIFLLLHTTGTVLGKAKYNDYLVVSQGCTVGAQNREYPTIGRGVALLPNSSIVGNCKIGNRVSIGISSTVYQQNIENQTVVYTDSNGILCFKKKAECWSQQFYSVKI
jgi:serine O-acetyltransferase